MYSKIPQEMKITKKPEHQSQHEDLPEPTGEIIPEKEWQQVFRSIEQNTPEMNVFDGIQDMRTRLLHAVKPKGVYSNLIVDELIPNLVNEIITDKRKLLVRGQYYMAGLHHRISFHAEISERDIYFGFPALNLIIKSPLYRVSNLFVAYPSKEKPVFLEIPVAGAPPGIRVVEMSRQGIKAYNPQARKLFPKSQEIDGIRVQLVDLGETTVNGSLSAVDDSQIQIKLNPLSAEANKVFDSYLEEGFKQSVGSDTDSKESTVIKAKKTDVKSIGEKKEPTALIILHDPVLLDKFKRILTNLGWECRNCSTFKPIELDLYEGMNLLVLDVEQRGFHAIDLLRNNIRDNIILPGRFILVGADSTTARSEEWRELGDGLFISHRASNVLIEHRIAQWLKVRPHVLDRIDHGRIRPTILVVDDDPEIVESVTMFLTEYKYDVLIATDGDEALQTAFSHQPDLILLDIDLPKLEGLDVLRVLRSMRETRNTPVIMMSGHRDMDSVTKARIRGISDYIVKPFTGENLIGRIEKILKSNR